jgi:hypothetical protein
MRVMAHAESGACRARSACSPGQAGTLLDRTSVGIWQAERVLGVSDSFDAASRVWTYIAAAHEEAVGGRAPRKTTARANLVYWTSQADRRAS